MSVLLQNLLLHPVPILAQRLQQNINAATNAISVQA
jgi:hypothetical protein